MATENIREFLVSLGFKLDQPGLKRFTSAIDGATKSVFKLAAAVEVTAVAISAGIARWASNLEALYFAAQRTGSTATQLKALDLAARNLGANAGEAQAAVEGLASALRTNPGNIGLLTSLLGRLGLTLKINADGSINSADALLKLSQVFKQMPFFQANQFAQQLGISEHTLYQLTHGNLVDEYRKSLVELGRGGFDRASEDAHRFMIQLRAFEAQLESFGVQVVDALQKKLGVSLESVRAWFAKNGPWLAGVVADMASNVIEAANLIIGKLKEWDEETGGLSTKLIALAVLLKVTGAGSVIGGVLTLAAAFGRLAGAINAVKLGIAALTGYGIWKVWKAAEDDQHLAPGQIPNIVKFKRWMNSLLPEKARIPRGILENNPGNLEFRNQPGALQDGRFAMFSSEGEGLFQLGRQLELYSARGLNTVQSILGKFAPAGENNLAAYIADVTKRTGFSATQALNLDDPGVLSNLMNAIIFHEQGYNPYRAGLVRNEADSAIDYVRGTTSIQQTNNYTITGSDPKEIAKHVANEQRRSNADLTRNFANAVN